MNIAVLIGISDYRVAAPLPACSRDVEEMRSLLSATKKYEEVLSVSTGTDSTTLKEVLRGFFGRYRDAEPVQEALVYFSGHGLYRNDVLLCCSDFDSNRPASTSLSNAELDDLLRSVSPAVAVKILDACQSGSPYIKDAIPGFEKALRESRLKSFICMASSRADQSSYASSECSLFTDRFIEAALSKTEGTVLYRDIQAALADSFVATPDQTPFFVTQGTGLEVFAQTGEEMHALRTARRAASTLAQPEDKLALAIAQHVKARDELFVSAESARAAIVRARKGLEEAPLSAPLASKFYEKRATFTVTLATLPGVRAVAEFADEQGWEKKYFLRVIKRPFRVRSRGIPAGALTGPFWDTQFEEATHTIFKPVHLEASEALPFEVAEVRFEARAHPSLKSFALYVALAHSLTELVVLSAASRLAEAGWIERSVDASQLKWQQQTLLWRDVVARPEVVWEGPLRRAQATIEKYLEGLVPREDEQKPAASGEVKHNDEASKTKG